MLRAVAARFVPAALAPGRTPGARFDLPAALLIPMPSRTDQYDGAYADMVDDAWRAREPLAEKLRLLWQEEGADPLLSTLEDLRNERLRLEAQMRLMAYGRCFTYPRPYKLIDLARAANLSIPGVRIAFTDDEITDAAEILGRPPVSDDGPPPAQE